MYWGFSDCILVVNWGVVTVSSSYVLGGVVTVFYLCTGGVVN